MNHQSKKKTMPICPPDIRALSKGLGVTQKIRILEALAPRVFLIGDERGIMSTLLSYFTSHFPESRYAADVYGHKTFCENPQLAPIFSHPEYAYHLFFIEGFFEREHKENGIVIANELANHFPHSKVEIITSSPGDYMHRPELSEKVKVEFVDANQFGRIVLEANNHILEAQKKFSRSVLS